MEKPMATDLNQVIKKLNDQDLQSRLRDAARTATINQLKKEGIELLPQEWGELTARLIAAQTDRKNPKGWVDDILRAGQTVGPLLGSIMSDRRLKTNITHHDTLQNGVRIFEFSYVGFTNRWKGVIARGCSPKPSKCCLRK
jgi:hypothetical protein